LWEPWLPKLDHTEFPNVGWVLEAVRVPGSEALWFLVWAFLPDARGSGEAGARGVAYSERLPARDVITIKHAAEELGMPERFVEPWEKFLKRFYRMAYRRFHRVPVVGWHL